MQIATTTPQQETAERSSDPGTIHEAKRFLLQEIWLPKLLYDLIPYFYLSSGCAALWTTIYVVEWYWSLPICILFSIMCWHWGIWIFSLRRRNRAQPVGMDQ